MVHKLASLTVGTTWGGYHLRQEQKLSQVKPKKSLMDNLETNNRFSSNLLSIIMEIIKEQKFSTHHIELKRLKNMLGSQDDFNRRKGNMSACLESSNL